MPSFRELLTAAKGRIAETDPAGAEALLAKGHLLLDVREPEARSQYKSKGTIRAIKTWWNVL